MSKKIITILLTFLIIFSICIPAFATEITEITSVEETEIVDEFSNKENLNEEKLTINEENITEETPVDATKIVNVTISSDIFLYTNKISFTLYSEDFNISEIITLKKENNFVYNNSMKPGIYTIQNVNDYSDKYDLEFNENIVAVSDQNTNIKLTSKNIPNEEKEILGALYVSTVISANITQSDAVSFTLSNNSNSINVMLSKDNNYSQTVNLITGEYKILNIEDNNKKYFTGFEENTITIDENAQTITLSTIENKNNSAFTRILKNSSMLLILFIGSFIALFVIRYRNGDPLIQIDFKKFKKKKK